MIWVENLNQYLFQAITLLLVLICRMGNNSCCEESATRLNHALPIEYESGISLVSIRVVIGDGFYLACIK